MGRPAKHPRGKFGEHIAACRERAGLTQTQLAEKLSVRQSSVAFWERGDKPPRGEVLPKLAESLGISSDELLGLKPIEAADKPKKGRLSEVFTEAAKLPKRQQAKLAEFVALFLAQQKISSD